MFNSLTRMTPSYSAPSDKLAHAFNNVSRSVGWVSIALPIGCLLAALHGLLPPDSIQDSISHFYYTPIMGDFFVGCLFFNGILLLFMFHTNGKPVPGWSNLNPVESIMMRFAGFSALMIAFFPTKGPSDSYGETEFLRAFVVGQQGTAQFEISGLSSFAQWPLHYLFALCMFSILAYFTLIVFTRIQSEDSLTPTKEPTPQKRLRNTWYRRLGTALVLCIAAMGLSLIDPFAAAVKWDAWNGTFVFEALGLLAFGFAWLIKGRAFAKFNDTAG